MPEVARCDGGVVCPLGELKPGDRLDQEEMRSGRVVPPGDQSFDDNRRIVGTDHPFGPPGPLDHVAAFDKPDVRIIRAARDLLGGQDLEELRMEGALKE